MVGCTGVQRACDRGWVGTPLAPTRPLDGRIACKRHGALGDRLGPTEPPHQALEPCLGRSVLHDFLRHLDLFMTGSHETPPAQIRAQGTQPGTCRRQGGRLGHGELLSARGTSDGFPCERGDALAGVRSPASSSPLFSPRRCAKNWQLEGFLLVFMRTRAMLLTAPLFGNRAIPPQLKIGLTVLVSLLVFPVVDARGIALPPGLISWALGIGGEVLLGITIGLMVRFVLAAVNMAGQLIGLEVGLSAPAL